MKTCDLVRINELILVTSSTFFLYINFFSLFLFLCFSLTTEPNCNYYLQVFIEHQSITIKQKKSQYVCEDLLSHYQEQLLGETVYLVPALWVHNHTAVQAGCSSIAWGNIFLELLVIANLDRAKTCSVWILRKPIPIWKPEAPR